jgi:hypothetical protein
MLCLCCIGALEQRPNSELCQGDTGHDYRGHGNQTDYDVERHRHIITITPLCPKDIPQ